MLMVFPYLLVSIRDRKVREKLHSIRLKLYSIRFDSTGFLKISNQFDSIRFKLHSTRFDSASFLKFTIRNRFDSTRPIFDSIRFRSLARTYWGRAKFIFVIYLINCSVICNYFRHNFLALYDIPPWLSKESSTHLIFFLF